jgi:hypothetical protein
MAPHFDRDLTKWNHPSAPRQVDETARQRTMGTIALLSRSIRIRRQESGMRACAAAVVVLAAVSAFAALSAQSVADEAAPNTPPVTDLSQKSGTLSDKLDSSNGVIRPSGAVYPKIEKSAPAVGAIRIIPPSDASRTETPK